MTFFNVAAVLALLAFWQVEHAVARSAGAPICPAGQSAPGRNVNSPHRPLSGFTDSSIADGGLTISIDGEELSTDTPFTVLTGTSYQVTVTSSNFTFRGILARLGGGDASLDTTGDFTLLEGETAIQISDPCLALGVGGITHTFNQNGLPEVSFLMEIETASSNMLLDLNIVGNQGPSVFYYSGYLINAADPTDAPTTAAPVVPPTSMPTDSPTTGIPTVSPTLMPTEVPTGPRTIYEIGVANELIVADLAAAAGLDAALDDPNASLTLLAPVNAAFEALPARITQYLVDNLDLLEGVLLGHVLEGAFNSSVVASLNKTSVMFLNGANQTVSVTSEGIFVGFAQVVGPDLFGTNGVVHLIDRILGLLTLDELLFGGTPSPDGAALRTAFAASGLTTDELQGVTLFAPTSTAFISLAGVYFDLGTAVLMEPGWDLHIREILLAHVFDAVVMSEDLFDGMVLTALNGDNFTVAVGNETVSLFPGSVGATTTVAGVAPIIAADAITTQGVVHATSGVLFASFLRMSVVDVVVMTTPTLARLVVAAELDGPLVDGFPLTVFAPTDTAFANLDSSILSFLETEEGKPLLIGTLSYHVVPAVVPSTAVETGPVSSLEGTDIDIVVVDGSVTLNGVANVIETDFLANNGIVHIIDTVLMLPATIAPTTTVTDAPTITPASKASSLPSVAASLVAAAAVAAFSFF